MNRDRQQGFSLVEILVCVSIIGVTFFLLAQSQLATLQSTAQSRDIGVTKARVQEALEAEQTIVLQATKDPATGAWVYNFDLYKTACSLEPCTYSRAERPNITYSVRSLQGGAVLAITATTTLPREQSTIGLSTYVSCYDVYPSASVSVPDPCPKLSSTTSTTGAA